ncbi:MAG TPA: R3H domain-containing nucleic acid-binding protein [Myxococcota bacterium]
MYDGRNEPHEFVADNRGEAVAKATRFFGMDAEGLAIKEYMGSQVSGLGGRTLVVAVPRDRKPPADRPRDRDRDRGERSDRSRSRDRDDRGRGRDRGEYGGGRGRDRGERGGGRDRDRGERGDRRSQAAAPRPEREATEPSVGTARGELGDAGKFLLGLIERLDVGPFEIHESQEGELVVYEITGAAAKGLSGGDGRPIDALQLLVNQAAMRSEEEPKRIVLDVEGNPEARERFLARLAERVVRRAREGGRAIALDPMSPSDRRIIHMAVRDHDGMATMSIGEGRYRQVLVVPDGAPEYEEALQQSESSRRSS